MISLMNYLFFLLLFFVSISEWLVVSFTVTTTTTTSSSSIVMKKKKKHQQVSLRQQTLQQQQPNHRISLLSSTKTTAQEEKQQQEEELTEEQVDFILGYMNKHHSDLLVEFVQAFSEIGSKQAKRNAFSGGSYKIDHAKIISIDRSTVQVEVQIIIRGKSEPQLETVSIPLDADPIPERVRYYRQQQQQRSGSSSTAFPPPISSSSSSSSTAIDTVVRQLNRLCWIVNRPDVTGKLIQLAIQLNGKGIGKLPENLFLNQVPHNRYVRKYFYDTAAEATVDACLLCSQGKISNRMKIISMFPEMNPSMDSYRIGTILEMARAIAIRLAEENLRVRICVQGSMGVGIFTGVPKQLNGVSRLLQLMDWQSNEGEENEGMIGNYVNFGHIGKEHVVNRHTIEQEIVVETDEYVEDDDEEEKEQEEEEIIPSSTTTKRLRPTRRTRSTRRTRPSSSSSSGTTTATLQEQSTQQPKKKRTITKTITKTIEQDDVFLLIAPQSMVGLESSIIGPLQEMVEAAGDRPIILLNPDLTDKISSQGQQSVRGRQDRINFANSFQTIYHFQNIYVSGTSYFPILGAITKLNPSEPYVAHQRRDRMMTSNSNNMNEEIYIPVLSDETKPEGEAILNTFET